MGEADPAPDAGKKWDDRRLQQTLRVDCHVVTDGSNLGDETPDRGTCLRPAQRISELATPKRAVALVDTVNMRMSNDSRGQLGIDCPADFRLRIAAADDGRNRQCLNDITQRAQPHYQDFVQR